MNLLAIPAWTAFSRGDVEDQQRNGKLLSLWERSVVRVARFVESRVRMPIGLDVFRVVHPRA